jgi:hypothetical protein
MISLTYLGIIYHCEKMKKKKIKMFKIKTIITFTPIMKFSQLIEIHQINNVSYTILGLITSIDLLTLIIYLHMNFLVK